MSPEARFPGGPTLTQIDAFVPSTGKVLNAGLLPQAEAFGGYTTVTTAHGAVGYIVGGEVAAQVGVDQAGVGLRVAAVGHLPAPEPATGVRPDPPGRAPPIRERCSSPTAATTD